MLLTILHPTGSSRYCTRLISPPVLLVGLDEGACVFEVPGHGVFEVPGPGVTDEPGPGVPDVPGNGV